MIYWMDAIAPANTLAKDFKSLLGASPCIDTRAMGFPMNWKEEPLWK